MKYSNEVTERAMKQIGYAANNLLTAIYGYPGSTSTDVRLEEARNHLAAARDLLYAMEHEMTFRRAPAIKVSVGLDDLVTAASQVWDTIGEDVLGCDPKHDYPDLDADDVRDAVADNFIGNVHTNAPGDRGAELAYVWGLLTSNHKTFILNRAFPDGTTYGR